MPKPKEYEYAPYYSNYIAKVPEGNLLELLVQEHQKTQVLFQQLPEEDGDFSYADGKWSIKELLTHMIDTEQIMSYRALRFARGDQQVLAGFDHDAYIEKLDTTLLKLTDLMEDWQQLRNFTVRMFSRFNEKNWQATGEANQVLFSVHALAHIILGHELHHRQVLEERYLSALK